VPKDRIKRPNAKKKYLKVFMSLVVSRIKTTELIVSFELSAALAVKN
jgi:hypothetical protein